MKSKILCALYASFSAMLMMGTNLLDLLDALTSPACLLLCCLLGMGAAGKCIPHYRRAGRASQ
jgi:hypothetical protein